MPEEAIAEHAEAAGASETAHEQTTATPPKSGGFMARLRRINKGQWIAIGVAVATLVVGMLAYRAMRGGASGSQDNAALDGTAQAGGGTGGGNDLGSFLDALKRIITAPLTAPGFDSTPAPDLSSGAPSYFASYTAPPVSEPSSFIPVPHIPGAVETPTYTPGALPGGTSGLRAAAAAAIPPAYTAPAPTYSPPAPSGGLFSAAVAALPPAPTTSVATTALPQRSGLQLG